MVKFGAESQFDDFKQKLEDANAIYSDKKDALSEYS